MSERCQRVVVAGNQSMFTTASWTTTFACLFRNSIQNSQTKHRIKIGPPCVKMIQPHSRFESCDEAPKGARKWHAWKSAHFYLHGCGFGFGVVNFSPFKVLPVVLFRLRFEAWPRFTSFYIKDVARSSQPYTGEDCSKKVKPKPKPWVLSKTG